MNTVPKVSIIMPVYNSGARLEGSLRSLFAQSLREIEVIAVDDGSSDESPEILDRLAAEDPRLKTVVLHANAGAHEARVAGIRISRAPWIGFLDADDFARPQMYQVLYDACQEDNADIAVCGSDRVSLTRRFIHHKVRFDRDALVSASAFERFCRMELGMGSLCNKLYERNLLLKNVSASFRWRQDSWEDTIINLGCFFDANRVRLLKSSLHEYVQNPSGATQQVNAAEAYVGLLRGYAVAVDRYHVHGRDALDGISELFRHQLTYDCYHVDRPEDLAPHSCALSEAVVVLSERDPHGLAVLVGSSAWKRERRKSLKRKFRAGMERTFTLPGLILSAIQKKLKNVT